MPRPASSTHHPGRRVEDELPVSPPVHLLTSALEVRDVSAQPLVSPNLLGAMGIRGSGSFLITAAKIDPRMKAIATVSTNDMGP